MGWLLPSDLVLMGEFAVSGTNAHPSITYPEHPMNPPQRRLLTLASGLLFLSSLVSCVGPYGYGYAGPNQQVGGVVGAGVGALAGAVIGNQSCRPLEGAAIGGAIGAIAGSLIGNAQDQVAYGQPGYYAAAPVYRQTYCAPVPLVVPRPYYYPGYAYGYGGGYYRGWGGHYGHRHCW